MKIGILQAGHAPDVMISKTGDYGELFQNFLAGEGIYFARLHSQPRAGFWVFPLYEFAHSAAAVDHHSPHSNIRDIVVRLLSAAN